MPGAHRLDDHATGRARRPRRARRRAPSARDDLRDPDRRAQPRRLDEHRQPQRRELAEHAVAIRRPARRAHARVVDLRDPGARQQVLRDDLVQAHGRREHARADVRHVEQLEQALHRAVLAERAVQHRERDLGVEQPAARAQRQLLAVAAATCPRASSSTSTTSWPTARRPAATAAPPASEISCSEERPPARTAILIGGGGVVVVVVGGSSWSSGGSGFESGIEDADGDRHRRAAVDLRRPGSGDCACTTPSLVRRVDRRAPRRRPSARRPTASRSPCSAVAPTTSGTSTSLGLLGDRDRHGRPARGRRALRRVLREHRARLGRRRPPAWRPSTRKPAPSSAARASSSVLPTTSGTTPCAGPLETSSVTVWPLLGLRVARRRLRGSRGRPSRCRPARAAPRPRSPRRSARLRAARRPRPTTFGTSWIRGPSEMLSVTRRALVDGRAARRRSARRPCCAACRSCRARRPTSKPSLRSRCVATEIELPTTLGTFARLGTAAMTIATMTATPTQRREQQPRPALRAPRRGAAAAGASTRLALVRLDGQRARRCRWRRRRRDRRHRRPAAATPRRPRRRRSPRPTGSATPRPAAPR